MKGKEVAFYVPLMAIDRSSHSFDWDWFLVKDMDSNSSMDVTYVLAAGRDEYQVGSCIFSEVEVHAGCRGTRTRGDVDVFMYSIYIIVPLLVLI